MEFDEYLAGKKIDSAAFRRQEAARWEAYRCIFGQVHPESFTTQKKFMLNDLRRRYALRIIPAPVQAPAAVPSPAARPVVPGGQAGPPPGGADAGAAPRPARPVMRPVVKRPDPAAPQPPDTGQTPAEPPEDVPARKPAPRPVIRRPGQEP